MAQYSVNNYSVDNIIEWIESGEIAIPRTKKVVDGSKNQRLLF